MAQPYVGEIRMFAGNFAPAGWMFCEGQLLPISENETLFQLIGTTYGGDGQATFTMPDLQGNVAMHTGGNHLQSIILGVVLLITALLSIVIGVVADLTRLNRTLAEEQLDLQKLQRYGD